MAAVLFMACSGASIEGSWVEPAPGMEHMLQGIKIESEVRLLLSIWQPSNMRRGKVKMVN